MSTYNYRQSLPLGWLFQSVTVYSVYLPNAQHCAELVLLLLQLISYVILSWWCKVASVKSYRQMKVFLDKRRKWIFQFFPWSPLLIGIVCISLWFGKIKRVSQYRCDSHRKSCQHIPPGLEISERIFEKSYHRAGIPKPPFTGISRQCRSWNVQQRLLDPLWLVETTAVLTGQILGGEAKDTSQISDCRDQAVGSALLFVWASDLSADLLKCSFTKGNWVWILPSCKIFFHS